MAQAQLISDLFHKYDNDNDGEIDHNQFGELIQELGYDSLYPGTIKKMIRRMNLHDPDKDTINLAQTQEFALSLSSPANHSIWKQKYSILEWANELRTNINKASGEEEGAAAPGAAPSKHPLDNSVQEGNVRILIGPNKPVYSSLIDIEIEKNGGGAKVKPFIKLSMSYKQPSEAKKMQTVFKEVFQAVLKAIGEQEQDWTQQMGNFHINSMVQGSTVTFFITTVNEELVSLIQLASQTFELCFGHTGNGKGHLRFEFDYDFVHFVTKEESSFYDLFVKGSRLMLNANAQHFVREFRKFFKLDNSSMFSSGVQLDNIIAVALLHIDSVDADIEFDCPECQGYELESKQQIQEGIKELMGFLLGLEEEKGIKIQSLLQLLDCELTVECSSGEWKTKVELRLLNIGSFLLKTIENLKKGNVSSDSDEDHTVQKIQLA